MGGTNGSALGALLAEALAEEERRLAALEARLAALRGGKVGTTAASDSTQAIWAALADSSPAEAEAPPAAPPAPPERDDDEELRAAADAADAADWAALSGVEEAGSPAPAELPDVPLDEPAAGQLDDPRLEAARRLLAESGQGLRQLEACLSRAPAWDDSEAPADERDAFWSAADGHAPAAASDAVDDDPPPPPPVPARERAAGPRPRDVEASRFGLERAFGGGDGGAVQDREPAWARALREDHARGLEALARVEELLVELGKTVAAVLERSASAPPPQRRERELEERAARAERERDDLRRIVAERSQRIARLEALVEQVMAAPGPAVPPPSLVQPVTTATPRGSRRPPAAPSEALRRTLLASPEASNTASRRALEALRPVVADDERARLRAALVQIGARHQQLVEEHAALLERLVKLLER